MICYVVSLLMDNNKYLKSSFIIPLKRIISLQKSDAFLVLRAQLANIVYDPEIWPFIYYSRYKTKEQPDHILLALITYSLME